MTSLFTEINDMTVKDLGLYCTWDVENKRTIYDTFTVHVGSPRSDLEDMVTFDTCVHLITQKNPQSPCELKIIVPRHKEMEILCVSVTSEARIIELYGLCGEYLTSMEATFIDECEDMPVYMGETKLPQPTSECLLKFVRPKRKNDMWVYRINIQLQKSEILPETSINFQNVNTILKESGRQLSEKADKCKKFFQLYGSTLLTSGNKASNKPELQVIMKMLESKYLHKYNPFSEEVTNSCRSKCESDLLAVESLVSKVSTPEVDTEETLVESEENEPSSCKNYLNQHILQCFKQLEDRLMTKMEEKFNELEKRQNEKFDLILLQLEKLQSNGSAH